MAHKFDVVNKYEQELRRHGNHTNTDVEEEGLDFQRVLDLIDNDIVRQTLVNEIDTWDDVDFLIGPPYVIQVLDALRLGQRLAREL